MPSSGILGRIKSLDAFHRNIVIVFLGTSLVNVFSLLYQLLIAHSLSPADFAAFNVLLAILTLVSTPFGTLQMGITKYVAEFNARGSSSKITALLSGLFRRASILAIIALFILLISSGYITHTLKIPSLSSGYILALLLSLSCIMPVFSGGLQGLEFFGYLTSASVLSGALKIILSFILIILGYKISGALGALLISNVIALFLLYFPLKGHISLAIPQEAINYKEIWIYLLPMAISYCCFMILVNSDMLLVKYFFNPQESGIYALAQMVGKIFLFLPMAIGTVMFPRTSGLNASNMDTRNTLKGSLIYSAILCLCALLFYNLFPGLVLKVLTGKAYPECIFLGRLFSLSMSFFTLLSMLMAYFLSVNDLRFIKYMVFFTALQVAAIILTGGISLIAVQAILCVNAALLLIVFFLVLSAKGKRQINNAIAI